MKRPHLIGIHFLLRFLIRLPSGYILEITGLVSFLLYFNNSVIFSVLIKTQHKRKLPLKVSCKEQRGKVKTQNVQTFYCSQADKVPFSKIKAYNAFFHKQKNNCSILVNIFFFNKRC